MDLQIPRRAVADDGADLCQPVRKLLQDLDLLGTDAETAAADGFTATFSGPPQSVALIEAGATAAAKWWATGLGAAILGAWGSVGIWWTDQDEAVQTAAVAGAALVTAALVLAIGYLVASDVRGRAAASVAVIQARANVATTMLEAVQTLYTPPEAAAPVEIIPLPGRVRATNLRETDRDNRKRWLVVAMQRRPDGAVKYILVKGSSEVTLAASDVEFNS